MLLKVLIVRSTTQKDTSLIRVGEMAAGHAARRCATITCMERAC